MSRAVAARIEHVSQPCTNEPVCDGDVRADIPAACLASPAICQVEQGVKAIANDTRLELLLALGMQPQKDVTTLADELDLALERVSSHLRALHKSAMVTCIRDGLHKYYALASHVEVVIGTEEASITIAPDDQMTVHVRFKY
jgi:DNA-binding transcriptional ArsR family regulator